MTGLFTKRPMVLVSLVVTAGYHRLAAQIADVCFLTVWSWMPNQGGSRVGFW